MYKNGEYNGVDWKGMKGNGDACGMYIAKLLLVTSRGVRSRYDGSDGVRSDGWGYCWSMMNCCTGNATLSIPPVVEARGDR